jgi:TonB family protein
MNFNERKNYMIALLLSLAFHLLLLLLFMAGYLAPKPAKIETFPVGMVEIAAGSPDGGGQGMMGSLPEKAVTVPSVKNPADNDQSKGKTVTKPKVTSKALPEEAIVVRKKEEKVTTDDHPGKKPNPGGLPATASGGTGGTGNSGSDKPFGFGSGEGMVTVLGPPPSYPKNAMNEGKEGNVVVRILVKADGGLENVFAKETSGDLRLDNAVTFKIRQTWKFKPVSMNYYIDLEYSFKDSEVSPPHFINSESRP